MNDLETFLYLLPVLLVSLTLHELAHAVVATRLGDPTPREQGRLTLNPLAHIDPLGTAMFAITYFLTGFIFGWAKPVLVDARRFRRPKESMALVAAAGPAVNFLIALGCAAIGIHVDNLGARTVDVLELAFELNIILGLFNLIPIPPLDGSRIVGAVMSQRHLRPVGGARPVRDDRALRGHPALPERVLHALPERVRPFGGRHDQDRRRMKLFEWEAPGPYRVAFSTRLGGVSEGPYASLNLGAKTDDDYDRVSREPETALCRDGR